MAYILSGERERGAVAAFARYRAYVAAERPRFPSGALGLAASEWYFDPQDHRCPHDGWLESLRIDEAGAGQRREQRETSITLQVLGAYHDLLLTFRYTHVRRYVLDASDVGSGHADWRFDEFRVGEDERLVHEIEWHRRGAIGRWLIESDDVSMEWNPVEAYRGA